MSTSPRKIVVLGHSIDPSNNNITANVVMWLQVPLPVATPQPNFKSAIPNASSYPTWQPNTSYSNGSIVVPVTATGGAYIATQASASLSAGSSPTFPTVAGATVQDGGVTWELAALDLNSGVTPDELTLLQAGLLKEIHYSSQPNATVASLKNELSSAYNNNQTNVNNAAPATRSFLISWDGTTWSNPL
jgi:hypothetical protein